MCTLNPVAMVSIYIPTAANISNPEVATVLVISPSTPMGASLIIISVIRIMAWKRDSKKEVNCDLWFPLSWVMAAPRKMAKHMRPNMSPLQLQRWDSMDSYVSEFLQESLVYLTLMHQMSLQWVSLHLHQDEQDW